MHLFEAGSYWLYTSLLGTNPKPSHLPGEPETAQSQPASFMVGTSAHTMAPAFHWPRVGTVDSTMRDEAEKGSISAGSKESPSAGPFQFVPPAQSTGNVQAVVAV